MTQDTAPNTIYLKDYTQPQYWIDSINLHFELGEDETRVVSEMEVRRNTELNGSRILELDGENLVLGSVLINEKALSDGEFSVTDESLWIPDVPDSFTLQIETFIKPQLNTSLEGLYKSSGNFCTQCEAQGFRKITYYLDRPDVMAKFTTTIVADKSKYPVLLSNGNPVDTNDLDDGKHSVTWEDPFKKPCYLFALVAGDLECIKDTFITMNKREIDCRIYVEAHNIDKCDHAMRSLKKSMRWDEETFGREYDLDIYMIVAVDDFNMGAMENKGLNVFNSKYVLARPDTATDTDFINIEAVIGHEYFHNWSGNRVTCRDWFQLTLKEGLTVFRDQQFTSDMNSASVKRIDDVNVLRTRQFAEDAGPMSHPIQPDSYVEINNFYTVTVYNKGAEIIRMIHTLLGKENFRQGMDIYFERHDGEAATTEDFINAMEDASDIDLTQFRRWYHQAGTPQLDVQSEYKADEKRLSLSVKQSSETKTNKPFHIPLSVSLIDSDGSELKSAAQIVDITEAEQVIEFEDVEDNTAVSILRNYSAPVKLNYALNNEQLAFLVANDSDEFNRWNCAQQLGLNIMMALIEDYHQKKTLNLDAFYISTLKQVLIDESLDKALAARILSLPSEDYMGQNLPVIDVDAIYQVREFCKKTLAFELMDDFVAVYKSCQDDEYTLTPQAMGQRSLKNICLSYMMCSETETARKTAIEMAQHQYKNASNMTDQISALRCLAHYTEQEGGQVLDDFYQQWAKDSLVIDKWFMVQATATGTNAFQSVQALLEHDAFDLNVPNRVRSLVGAFTQANAVEFHHMSGQGYQFLADIVIKLNTTNPQIAARLLLPLIQWKSYDVNRQLMMKAQLQRVSETPDLAKDVFEITAKGLAG
ncbi:MAG: aminopeptidase N [endosymbiont of Galathealinum brachiosum]|uniref:Aminopeptidase N n=1 Tax=endosymbiont of Galathealinum brachiosum TaxID=2200906 RepID=A0A370DJN5_9GAMM|nr:MAG: aminopeptidase N [endosymbiont of Galathealinum brachiosum]